MRLGLHALTCSLPLSFTRRYDLRRAPAVDRLLHKVVATRDATTQTVQLFVDDVLVKEETYPLELTPILAAHAPDDHTVIVAGTEEPRRVDGENPFVGQITQLVYIPGRWRSAGVVAWAGQRDGPWSGGADESMC